MKAVLVERAGGPEVLRLVDLPSPVPMTGEVRIRLAAIGVNFADTLCRRATHRSMRRPPIVCGCEGAGIVEACGPGVSRHRVGDRVSVYAPFGGGYAEAIVAPEDYVLPLPDTMSFDDAAAFTHVALTAHAALTMLGAPTTRGATLLVTAAAGGLGGMLCQLGAERGMRVLAGVGSATKRATLMARGFDEVIDYGSVPLDTAVLGATRGRGVDLAIETVGGALFGAATSALAPLGRIVIAGAAGGELPQPDAAALLDRCAACATLNLSVLFEELPDAMHFAWASLMDLFAAGRLRPRIGRRFALHEAEDAQRFLESRASIDKLLLIP